MSNKVGVSGKILRTPLVGWSPRGDTSGRSPTTSSSSQGCPPDMFADSQFDLWFTQGRYWNGTTVTNDPTQILTTSRASSETAQWADGRITYPGNNIPAISNIGLQSYQGSTNLLLQSQFAATWTATRSSLNTTTTSSPDGSTNATFLKEDSTATSTHIAIQTLTKAASALPYTVTIYAQASTRTRIMFLADDNTNGAVVGFDLSGGQVAYGPTGVSTPFTALSSSIIKYLNGWCRCQFNFTTNTATTLRIAIELDNGSGTAAQSNSYSGDGVSGAFIFGAQAEQISGGVATPYIPTTTGSVTRAADVITLTNGGTVFAAPQTACTVLGIINMPQLNASIFWEVFSAEDATNFFRLRNDGSLGKIAAANTATSATGSQITINTIYKAAAWVNSGNNDIATNGTLVQSIGATTLPSSSGYSVNIGGTQITASRQMNGFLQRLVLWSSAKSDAFIKAIST